MQNFDKTLIPCFRFSCFNSSKISEVFEGLKTTSFGFDTFWLAYNTTT